MNVITLVDQPKLVPTNQFKYGKFKFEYFNPCQSRIFEVSHENANFVISTSTGSGKTAVSELIVSQVIRQEKKKAIYLGPQRALMSEKLEDWLDLEHHFSDLKVSICTGDYRFTNSRKEELDNADVIVATTEAFNSFCRSHKAEKNRFLQDVGVLVADECFPFKTPIRVTTNIELPIGRVVNDESITHVMAFDETSGRVVPKKILRRITNKLNKGLVSVNHQYGKFVCTEDHKIWTDKGFIKAKELSPGDKLKWIPLDNNLVCNICGRVFKSRRFLTSHYLYKHLCPGANAVHINECKQCPKCSKDISIYGYESHLKSCGKQKPPRYVPRSRVCRVCGKQFISALSRATHEKHHNFNREYYRLQGEKLKSNPKFLSAMKELGKQRMGENNPTCKTPGGLERLKKTAKDRWANLSETEKIAQINRFIQAPKNKTHGTKLELFVEEVCSELPMRRTSGGKFWLTFKNGKKKNPDFKVNGQRKVVEVGDTEFWHTEEEIRETISLYSEINYKCLYLTDRDVDSGADHVRSLVIPFINNHSSEVVSVKNWGRGGIENVYDLEVEDCHNYFANGVLVSNCHGISYPGRGDHLEVGLMKFIKINPTSKLVALSATMPNSHEISEWLATLTDRKTYLLESKYRPCPLFIHYETYEDSGNYEDKEYSKIEAALQIIKEYPDDKFIIFTHSLAMGNMVKKRLEKSGYLCDFHYSGLEKEKRQQIEQGFKSGDLKVVVATSTLAAGVNLPARRVIILGVHRGLDEVDAFELFQEAGRSGRPGLDDRGDAYILIPHSTAQTHLNRLSKPQNITSRLLDFLGDGLNKRYKNLAFHIVSEIHQKEIKTKEDVYKWYERSLAFFQVNDLTDKIIDSTIDLLIQIGIIKLENGEYETTMLGNISSMFYFSPFDIASFKRNFNRLFKFRLENNDLAIAMALGDTDTMRGNIVSKAEREEMAEFTIKVQHAFKDEYELTNDNKGMANQAVIKAGFVYYSLMRGDTCNALGGLYRNLKFDFPRLQQVLISLDSMACKWDKTDWFTGLGVRINKGVSKELVELCKIPNIGAVRAKKLMESGIKDAYDIVTKEDLAMKILGRGKISQTIIEAARDSLIP